MSKAPHLYDDGPAGEAAYHLEQQLKQKMEEIAVVQQLELQAIMKETLATETSAR